MTLLKGSLKRRKTILDKKNLECKKIILLINSNLVVEFEISAIGEGSGLESQHSRKRLFFHRKISNPLN